MERSAEGACFWTKKRNADGWHGEWENGIALKVGEPQEFEEENTPDCGERNDRTLQN